MLYLNYAALCPTLPEAREAAERTQATFGRLLHSETGLEWYGRAIRECRHTVGALLRVDDPSTIAFTANASAAHHGALSALRWRPGDAILTTTHENPSITRQMRALEQDGVRLEAISPASPDAFLNEVRTRVSRAGVKALVMSHVSHVDGRVLPVRDAAALAKAERRMVIIDGAQAVGQIPVNLDALDFDVYFFTGHKWCEGPPGTGAMVARDSFFRHPDCRTVPEDAPGGAASRFEIGMRNIGLIAGLATACEHRRRVMPARPRTALRDAAKAALGANPRCRVVEWRGPHAPGILTFAGTPDRDHGRWVTRLESEYGMIVKLFADYPEGVAPAIRLSWPPEMPRQDFRTGLSNLARLLAS